MALHVLPRDDQGRLIYDSYARLSKNEDGELEKIDRQLKDNQGAIANVGGVLGRELYDNSLSAWRRGVRRPDWDELLHRMRTGLSAGVAIWHSDRLMRRSDDLEMLINMREELGIQLINPYGFLDLSDNLMGIRVAVAHADQSSRDTSRRIKRKFAGQREDGILIQSGRRCFGFPGPDHSAARGEDGKYPPVPAERVKAEGKALEKAYDQVLAGRSMRLIAAQWNAAGLTGTTGKSFTTITIRQLLLRPRNVGRIVHGGRYNVVGVASNVKPLVDPDKFDEVGAMIAGRRKGRQASGRYLASGLIFCAECGTTLVMRPYRRRKDDPPAPRYSCLKDRRGCGKVSISMGPVDEWLRDLTVERLSDVSRAERIDAALARSSERAAELDDQLKVARSAKLRVMARYGEGELTDDEADAALAPLNRRIKAMAHELDELRTLLGDDVAVQAMSAAGVTADWEGADTEGKRALLTSALRGIKVVVTPQEDPRPGPVNLSRLQVVPLDGPLS